MKIYYYKNQTNKWGLGRSEKIDGRVRSIFLFIGFKRIDIVF